MMKFPARTPFESPRELMVGWSYVHVLESEPVELAIETFAVPYSKAPGTVFASTAVSLIQLVI
jgi:hypothetical protein